MASRTFLALITALCCAGSVVFSLPVNAETPLTEAIIQRLVEKVDLHVKQKSVRAARLKDMMTPGDALQTFRRAMAELRFNDSSVARIGEQAIFEFEPNTRNLDLKKGTVLLLIKPGQGRTRVRTPNAAAGIRGSALFVRYIEDTGVTMVGALTNSGIEISNKEGTSVVLKAGQLAYVYKNQIGVYNFDQKLFQETSPFFKGIDWDEAPVEVKAEIEDALKGQQAIAGKYEDDPVWTKLADHRTNSGYAAEPQTATTANANALYHLGPQRFDLASKDWFPTSNSNTATSGIATLTPPSAAAIPIPRSLISSPPALTPSSGLPPVSPIDSRPSPVGPTSPPGSVAAPPPPTTPLPPTAGNPPGSVPAPPPPGSAPGPLPGGGGRPDPTGGATPATPAIPSPGGPATPAVPATPPVVNTPVPTTSALPPAPVTPAATPIVNTAPVPASPPVNVAPPVATTPAVSATPAIPATPPAATAPLDMPQTVTTPTAPPPTTTAPVTTTPAPATPTTTTTPTTTPATTTTPTTTP